jgi:hypothetical protein
MFGPSEGARSGSGWVSMNRPRDADRDRARGQRLHELPLPAGGRALPARLLHRMRGVEDHRQPGSRAMIGSARMSETSVL